MIFFLSVVLFVSTQCVIFSLSAHRIIVMKCIPAEANNSITYPPFNKYFKVEPYKMTDCAGQNRQTLAVSDGSVCSALAPGAQLSSGD